MMRNIKLFEVTLLLIIVVGFVLMGGVTNNFSYALQPQSSSDEVELFSGGAEIAEQPTLDIQHLLGANFGDVRHLFGTEISHGAGKSGWYYTFDTGLSVAGYDNGIIDYLGIGFEHARSLTEINFRGIDGTSTHADVVALLGDSPFSIIDESFYEEHIRTVCGYWAYEYEFVRFWFGESGVVESIIFFHIDYVQEASEPEDYAETITVMLDGQRVEFTDQQPVIIDGRTLVPVRGVFEQLGFEVSWNPETQQATLTGDDVVIITIGSDVFTTNGMPGFLDVPAQTIEGRTMLPIRHVLESVGFTLTWDGAESTIYIIENTNIPGQISIRVCPSDTIQDLFEPKDSVIYFEGMPYSIRLYPFGEIVGPEEYGRASFVIFVEADHAVEQCINFLRITTPLQTRLDELGFSGLELSMEIIQLADITATDAEHQIKSEIDFSFYQNISIRYPTEDFPFRRIHLSEGSELDSKITRIYIKDNNHGGVFVITVRLNIEFIGCAGVRFGHYIRTLSVIDAVGN